jgi:heme oxygenase
MNSEKPHAYTNYGEQTGERWRRFLERIGTHSNDFAARLARARFVYLHRRETRTHWLPL